MNLRRLMRAPLSASIAAYHTVVGIAALCITAKFGGQCLSWVLTRSCGYVGSNVRFARKRTLLGYSSLPD
jgi:hypothetical protein